MNTAERIVENYFRIVRRCFTVADIKIEKGKGRQIDLLAYSPSVKKSYHVETSVSHEKSWIKKNYRELPEKFRYKFFGVPRNNEKPNSDYGRGTDYLSKIEKTYVDFGLDPCQVTRIWCGWALPEGVMQDNIKEIFDDIACSNDRKNIGFEYLSFGEIIEELEGIIGKSNYEDDLLRFLSLYKELNKKKDKSFP